MQILSILPALGTTQDSSSTSSASSLTSWAVVDLATDAHQTVFSCPLRYAERSIVYYPPWTVVQALKGMGVGKGGGMGLKLIFSIPHHTNYFWSWYIFPSPLHKLSLIFLYIPFSITNIVFDLPILFLPHHTICLWSSYIFLSPSLTLS